MIPVSKPFIGKEEKRNVDDAIKSGWLSHKGDFVEEFEKRFAKFCGAKYGVATNSGTTALELAVRTSEVHTFAVPALTYASTAFAVTNAGRQIIFYDVGDNWCMGQVGHMALTVHLYGREALVDAGVDIVDCAEAHGTKLIGNVGCFSFYPNKIITTGEGGMCVTNDKGRAEAMRHIRDQCMVKPYIHDGIGSNFAMSNLQAAVGCAQMDKIEDILEKRKIIEEWYRDGLDGIETMPEGGTNWLFSILVNNREKLMKRLKKEGIETRPFFSVLPSMKPYFDKEWKEKYPVATDLSLRGLNLPTFHEITKDQVDFICEAVLEFAK